MYKAIKELETLKRPKRLPPSPIKSDTDKPQPVLLNKLAPSNQRFEDSRGVKRRRKETQSEPVADEIVVGNYEIQFVDHEGKSLDETQQVYQVEKVADDETHIEIIEETQFTEVDEEQQEEEESAQSDEEYKPPTKNLRRNKLNVVEKPLVVKKKRKSATSTASTPLVKKDVTANALEDNYFVAIDADEKDLDENGEKKIFQCSFENCTERFARRQACKTHFYNHLTTKAVTNGFTCQFCQKCFKVASALERHERVHTKEKPFLCDFEGCTKAFSQNEMLKRHKVKLFDFNKYNVLLYDVRYHTQGYTSFDERRAIPMQYV